MHAMHAPIPVLMSQPIPAPRPGLTLRRTLGATVAVSGGFARKEGGTHGRELWPSVGLGVWCWRRGVVHGRELCPVLVVVFGVGGGVVFVVVSSCLALSLHLSVLPYEGGIVHPAALLTKQSSPQNAAASLLVALRS